MKNYKKLNLRIKSFFSSISAKGMTLVEILIALSIMTIVLGAIYSILHVQRMKSINVQTTTVLQTDAQVAMSLLRWDLFMLGLGIANTDTSVWAINRSDGSDTLKMHSIAFGFEASEANWTPVLETVSGTNTIRVFRHSDSLDNFKRGDTISIISQERKLLEYGVVVLGTTPFTYMGGEDSIPGLLLTVDRGVFVNQGGIAIKIDSVSYFDGISYYINDSKQLMRGTEIFLDNVEDIQFKYGVDQNGNGEIEDAEWYDDLSGFSTIQLSEYTIVIRATIVALSERGLGDYRYGADTVIVEDHAYPLSDVQKRYKRIFVRSVTYPRNLRVRG